MAERPGGGLRGWWRRRSLRARLTLLATLMVAAGLVAGALLLVGSLRASLLAAVDATARQRAQDVAALVDQGRLPDPIPAPAASGGTVLVQVVDARGRVRAASVGSDRAVPLLPPAALARARARAPWTGFLDGARVGQRLPLRVIAWPAGPPGDPVTVIAAVSLGSVADSVHLVGVALALGVPLLLALVAITAWTVVGRTLRPVGELRRGAEEISAADPARRLPLPAARDELHRLAETLNRMLDRLEEAGSRQRAFVADAAHELRSPLAGMQAQLEVALHRPEAADWREVAGNVLVDALRLGRMVEDLLLLARLDDQHGLPAGRMRVVDLGQLAADAASRLVLPERVALRQELAAGVRVRADPAALGRVLDNLLANAARHATTRVELSLRAGPAGAPQRRQPAPGSRSGRSRSREEAPRRSPSGPVAVLAVADDGPGIPPADRERVFERYARLDDARARDAGGAGLGLAIVRELVRAHHGEVTVEDATGARPNPGARFVVTLPAAPADAEAPASPPSGQLSATKPA